MRSQKPKHHSSITLVILMLFLLTGTLTAQIKSSIAPDSFIHFCASDELKETKFNSNPKLLQKHEEIENQINEYLKSSNRSIVSSLYTLPVVVHIIHNNGVENISDATAIQAIQDLNDAFANMNYYDQGTGVNTQIQFCLARRDPNGNATTGINRVVSSLTNMNVSTDDLALKNLIRWEPYDYINIWLVKEICSTTPPGCGVAGYAYFPSSHGTLIDGIVMEANYFGSNQENSSVLVHEMGHYLGLYHTFQGGCSNNDCTLDGDRICDTPPDGTTARQSCSVTTNSCSTDEDDSSISNPFRPIGMGGLGDQNDMFNNYMDYSRLECYNAFTLGQSERMAWHIDNVRFSLLDSDGCTDPCLSPIFADFSPGSTTVNVGDNITFTNNSTGATNYEWFVDGITYATTTDINYQFGNQGMFDVTLVAENGDPNCTESLTVSITVVCPVAATFTSSSTVIAPGNIIHFNSTNTNAVSYNWQLKDYSTNPATIMTVGTGSSLSHTFLNAGNYDVCLIVSNGTCSNTSTNTAISVITGGLAQTGLPIWPLTSNGQTLIHDIDWRVNSPLASTISNGAAMNSGQTGAAFNNCGDIAFYVVHTGSSMANNLFIYKQDGTPLLDGNTSSGPGLNGVRGGHEIQVVPVPGTEDEFYIIYNEWSSDLGAPNNNAAYNLARMLYSKVKLSGSVLTVIDRDIVLTNPASTTDYLYNDGRAVSRTVNGIVGEHYLYACKRTKGSPHIKLVRFHINSTGITYNGSSSLVHVGWWDLTGAGSPIELSPTEQQVAVVNRNQDASNFKDDVILFDAISLSTPPVEIKAGNLVLVADGNTSNGDLSNILNSNNLINTVATTNSNLQFLVNFERKLSDIEFSPSGRFLYFTGGGFSGSGSSYLTYLAQIDLLSNPLEVRMQIQTTPNNNFNTTTGQGCSFTSGSCLGDWKAISKIQSSYDGNLYFTNRVDNILYVIPNPNGFLPQNLIPSDIDLSTTLEPNIVMNGTGVLMPDQIDGFNYLQSNFSEVNFAVNATDCNGNCLTPYSLDIVSSGTILHSFTVNSCPEVLNFCVDLSLDYDLVNPATGLGYSGAISNGTVLYPAGESHFDFSTTPYCPEICSNGIDDDNDGLIDCDDPDIMDDCCCYIPPVLDLGADVFICDNGTTVLDAGTNFSSYIWQDGWTGSTYTAWNTGTYSVTVTDQCGATQMSSVNVMVDTATVLELGTDVSICEGGSIVLTASGFNQYIWSPVSGLDCSTCATVIATPTTTTTYAVTGTTSDGCVSIDSVTVFVEPCNSCVTFFEEEIICNNDQSYSYSFYVHNKSSQVVTSILLSSNLAGYTISPSFLSGLSIPANSSAGPFTVTVTPDNPLTLPKNFCFNAHLFSNQGICCFVEHCIVIQECAQCLSVVQDSIFCNIDGTYQYNFTVTNNSAYTITDVLLNLTSGPSTVDFLPNAFNVSIIPGGQVSLSSSIGPSGILTSGDQLLFNVIMIDNASDEFWCCHVDDFVVTIPECEPICPLMSTWDITCSEKDIDGDHQADYDYSIVFTGQGFVSSVITSCSDIVLPTTFAVNGTTVFTGTILSSSACPSLTIGFNSYDYSKQFCGEERHSVQYPACESCIDPSLIDLTVACPALGDPVCGCDNNNYHNACVAEYWNGITQYTPGLCFLDDTSGVELFGSLHKNNTVQLEWGVMELVVSSDEFFVIQRSLNGTDWNNLSEVSTELGIQEYEYNDTSPFQGMNHYRILFYKGNGVLLQSNDVEVEILLAEIAIYPNPASNELNLNLNESFKDDVQIQIMDINGRTCESYMVKEGIKQMNLDISKLSGGVYFIQVGNHQGANKRLKFVKIGN